MSESKMASVEEVKTSNRGFQLTCELKKFPSTFVNGLRRILLSGIPTVVIRDVQILENTSQMPHEMLKHRVEMLPVNVHPTDAATIKEAKIELKIKNTTESKEVLTVTTDDFMVESGREGLLMKDRDLDTPILFLRLRHNEGVTIKARLALETENTSQVCLASTAWHVDPELVKVTRKAIVDAGKEDVRIFDNIGFQRCYSRDERGRPNWFDLTVESNGILQAKELLQMAVSILRKRVNDYVKEALENIQREQDDGSYRITLEQGGHTIGALMQEVIYSDANVNFVSYDIAHPLRSTMILRFQTKKSPESILKLAKDTIEEYCSVVEKGL